MDKARELAEQLVNTHDELWIHLRETFIQNGDNGAYYLAACKRLTMFEESSFNAKYHLRAIQNIIDLYEERAKND